MVMANHKIKILRLTLITLIIFGLGFAPIALTNPILKTSAATIEELEAQSQKLQSAISANDQKVRELGEKADSLEVKVSELESEISRANNQIKLTEVNLKKLRIRLKNAEEELQRQKGLLKATLQALYERKGASTLELLMATDSFTDFVSEQESLGQLQSAIKQSTEKVIVLKLQIESEKKEQERLLKNQKNQRAVVDAKRAEQQDILDKTKGQESKYKALVRSQRSALQKAEKELAALLAARNDLGTGQRVKRGQVIGALGSTGYSTGPHIHFQVYRNGYTLNPSAGGASLINGYSWPLLGGVGYISQSYGCVAPAGYYLTSCNGGRNSFHNGLDIASSAHTPVVAAADGEIIFKGCKGGLGHVVVVNHGGGWQTWYPHMVTPSGQIYGYCN